MSGLIPSIGEQIAFLKRRGWSVINVHTGHDRVTRVAMYDGFVSGWPLVDALRLEADADAGDQSACALLGRAVPTAASMDHAEDALEYARRRVG